MFWHWGYTKHGNITNIVSDPLNIGFSIPVFLKKEKVTVGHKFFHVGESIGTMATAVERSESYHDCKEAATDFSSVASDALANGSAVDASSRRSAALLSVALPAMSASSADSGEEDGFFLGRGE